MSVYYRKSKKVGKNTRLNVSSSSVGISTGVKGATVGLNSKGRASINLSIPGTGLRYRKTFSSKGSGGAVATLLMIFLGFINIMIYMFRVAIILCWWMIKVSFVMLYYLCLYTYKACKWCVVKLVELVKFIINKIQKSKSEHADMTECQQEG
jgi:hypothetical protein